MYQPDPQLEELKTLVPAGGAAPSGQGAMQAGVPTGEAPAPMDYQTLNRELETMMQNNPEGVEQMKQEIMAVMESGELTPQELNKMVQLARAALQDPKLYPQIRQYAIQQGLGTEQDIPPEFDQGLLMTLVIAGRALQGGGKTDSKVMPSMKQGGPLPSKSPNADGSIPIEAHEGEYVVPAEVVKYYGTKFLDGLKEKMEKAINGDGAPVGN